MKVLNNKELKSIEYFFQLKQDKLLLVLNRYLQAKYDKVIVTKDYIVAVGDIPVALVAHLDTVFPAPPTEIYYDRTKNVMWSPTGLGADDRSGVYSIIQLVKKGYKPTVIFTTDEERGALGAEALIKDIPIAPYDFKYIIELDRRGSDDCVFYDCNVPDFEEYVESFGFVMNFGTFSDISIICPAWKVAGVNLSIGYYNEHSTSETLNIGQMMNTIKKVEKMLQDAKNAKEYRYIETQYASRWFKPLSGNNWDWDPAYGISKEQWASFMEPQHKCNDCGIWDYDYNMFPAKHHDQTLFFCADCISTRPDIHWCGNCGEAFVDETLPKNKLAYCEDCRNVGKVKNNENKNTGN